MTLLKVAAAIYVAKNVAQAIAWSLILSAFMF
jgi:hypothetical protein